ncbi:MAG: hypothetical protein NW216_00710 [Hyphomicrobium sp.]|nr:hypothetical protein [Hyphomicrobium sp.]
MNLNVVELLIGWLPVLLLIAVFAYFARKSQSAYISRSGKTHGEMLEEYLAEMRRQNDLLERMVSDQETRIQRLETTRRAGAGGGGGGGAGR